MEVDGIWLSDACESKGRIVFLLYIEIAAGPSLIMITELGEHRAGARERPCHESEMHGRSPDLNDEIDDAQISEHFWVRRAFDEGEMAMSDFHSAIKLNSTHWGWAVVFKSSGALVTANAGLLIKMTQSEARYSARILFASDVKLSEGYSRRTVTPAGRRRRNALRQSSTICINL